ncbi:MAG: TonB-dependent receptor [Bacteroidetes bacterium]|nr:TonB-dependent receptor [Bacteroidota bacterium]
MKKIILTLALAIAGFNIYAQTDTLWISGIEITAKRTPALYSEASRVVSVITKAEIKGAPVQSFADLLEYTMNVDVRQRGHHGVQADISIRGGSFDQTMILVNGIPFNDPQTGHHNADLPIDLESIERIEILEGPASRTFGPNAFSGAINIITIPSELNEVKIALSKGEYEFYSAAASLNTGNETLSNGLTFSKKGSGGYIENTDYQILNLFYLSQLKLKSNKLTFQAAYQDKSFGANSFYTPVYPNQYEQTKTRFISANWQNASKIKSDLSIYWKQHNDRFELFRSNPASWYSGHNYHQTQVYGLEETINIISGLGKSAFGTSYRREQILSNILGIQMDSPIAVRGEKDAFYKKKDHRDNLSFFIEHSYYTTKWSFSGGLLANYNSAFDWHWIPGVDLSYQLSNNLRLFSSVNKSFRLPTFTDLYYVGPTNIGNSDLKPEEAIAYEAGLKFINHEVAAEMAIFKRDGGNIIDWVRVADSLKWESKNITELSTTGIEVSVLLNSKFFQSQNLPINQLRLSYSYTDVSKQSGEYQSKYALDYLKHKFAISLSHPIIKYITINWQATYQDRAGSYFHFKDNKETAYAPFVLFDSKINWEIKNWDVYLEIANILNIDYFDIGNVMMPGRWIRFGLSTNLRLKK